MISEQARFEQAGCEQAGCEQVGCEQVGDRVGERTGEKDREGPMMDFDMLIRGGRVVDPSQSLDAVRDVGIRQKQIEAIEPSLHASARHVVDARGMIVTPGLIDLHVHAYRDHSEIGLDPDRVMVSGGVTTMLDAGSAGAVNFGGFRRDIIDHAEAEVLGLVNLACMGLVVGNRVGELADRRYADVEGVIRTIAEHPGVAVGVKIRAGKHIIGEGEQGWANFRDAIAAARRSSTWLMVHIGESPMSIPEMLERMEPGDCITHCFKSGSERILDGEGRIFPSVLRAAERGVIFDVGHGFGSFHWDVCQAAIEQGFEPTTISTDLHSMNLHGPVYDMPTTMSKFLALGIPLARVIEMTTCRPAAVLGRSDDLGTLRVGSVADVTIMDEQCGAFALPDSYGQVRVADRLLTTVMTIRRGEVLAGGGAFRTRHRVESPS